MTDSDLKNQLEDLFSDTHGPVMEEMVGSALLKGLSADLLDGTVVTEPGAPELAIPEALLSTPTKPVAEQKKDDSLLEEVIAGLFEDESVSKPEIAEPSPVTCISAELEEEGFSPVPVSSLKVTSTKQRIRFLHIVSYVLFTLLGLLFVSLLIGLIGPILIADWVFGVLYLAGCVVAIALAVIQWRFNLSLAGAFSEDEEEHTQAVTQTQLEDRVKELTAANTLLEKRARQARRANQVSHALSTALSTLPPSGVAGQARQPDNLVQEAMVLVCDLFDLCYVGLFLIDESGQWAVLQEGTQRRVALRSPILTPLGIAGQADELDHPMLAPGYRLEVGGASMVGRCIAKGQALTVLDLDEEAYHHNYTLLPGARSEMTLPLRSGGRVIGALDLQSPMSRAFSRDEIDLFQTLADQLAVAIDSAQTLAELKARLEAAEEFQRSHAAAQQQLGFTLSPVGGFSLYERTRLGVTPLGDRALPEAEKSMTRRELIVQEDTRDGEDHTTLTAPITLRGEVIGMLGFHQEDSRQWTADEIALIEDVSAQVSLAVENVRLFEQTQAALAETEALYRASHRITTSADLHTLYQVFVDEMASRMGADQCQLTIFDHVNGYGQVVSEHRPTPDVDKIPIPIASNPAYVILRDTQRPVVIEDLSRHPAFADYAAARTATRRDVKSMLLVPILVRGELIGSLEIDYERSAQGRAFSEAELDFCQTLAGQAAITIDNMRTFEEQKETAERLREMDKLKTQFLANMSHELRTPLNSIIGFSRVILKGIDGPLTEMQETDLTAIYNSGQHLLGLINDILDLSKIEAGKMELNFDEADLKPIIKGVMSSAVGLVKDKPIELEQRVPDDLPNVWADATRIRQVLLNLISNATKFTEEGKITLMAGYDDKWVTIKVTDTGEGIPEEKLDSIFEEFTQVDGTTTRSAGGTGLGLPISRHFVEMHGGEISVESEVGVGSTFTVILPCYAYVQTQPEMELGERGKSSEFDDVSERRTVLAVDDDPGVISLYRRFLESEGYQVVGLTNSEEVLDKAAELQPFAITLDVLMPAKDGWQVLRELKACPKTQHIPIIMCSIVSNEGLGFSLGAADYLVKPIMEGDLLAVLSRVDQHYQEGEIEVLVIDDQADDILLIRRMLEAQRRYRVIEADGGQAGIDLVRQRKPDIVILDLMMPEVDGFAVLEDLKRGPDTRNIPIIVITAKDLTEEEQQQLNGQVEVLLRKGLFTEQELLEDLGKALGQIELHPFG